MYECFLGSLNMCRIVYVMCFFCGLFICVFFCSIEFFWFIFFFNSFVFFISLDNEIFFVVDGYICDFVVYFIVE